MKKSKTPTNNFGWIASWQLTRRCNLYCVYCDHKQMRPVSFPEEIDYLKVVDSIALYAPKVLNISGGEPTLVAQLPAILAKVKQLWNPFTRVVSNGTMLAKIVPSLQNLDRLVISLDGPGETNRANRGVDGDLILKNIESILPQIRAAKTEIAINCVITAQNAGLMTQFAQNIAATAPEIYLSVNPVMPPLIDISILKTPAIFDAFLKTFDELKGRGFNIMHTFDHVTRHENFSKIECYNQYFVIHFSPEGRMFSCTMDAPLQNKTIGQLLPKLLSVEGMKKALTRAAAILKRRSGKVDFTCRNICNCESWLDLLFLGRESNSYPAYLRPLKGRLTDEDMNELDKFVRVNINPRFDIAIFRQKLAEV